ncbi:MAG TPA: hypothetical protein VK563_22980 [Puia sp.]|nr:hypothetical protein [Puia sp.]
MYSLKILIAGLCLNSMVSRGQAYRQVGREKFVIVDTAGFYLYRINKLVMGEKISRPQDVYYFSVKPDAPVLELTLVNLESAFSANARFRYALEEHFRSDKQLIAYDPWLKVYKLKYLYNQSYH